MRGNSSSGERVPVRVVVERNDVRVLELATILPSRSTRLTKSNRATSRRLGGRSRSRRSRPSEPPQTTPNTPSPI